MTLIPYQNPVSGGFLKVIYNLNSETHKLGSLLFCEKKKKVVHNRDRPGGSVVENRPASAGDVGSIPGPGRSHMLWSS